MSDMIDEEFRNRVKTAQYHYRMQWNNDEESCVVLTTLISQGWELQGFCEEGGFAFIELMLWKHKKEKA